MKPDKKYMSEASFAPDGIHFTPPSFSSILRQNNISDKQNSQDNSYLDLYPSETEGDFLYCYYSSFGDCELNNNINNYNTNNSNNSSNYNNNNQYQNNSNDSNGQSPNYNNNQSPNYNNNQSPNYNNNQSPNYNNNQSPNYNSNQSPNYNNNQSPNYNSNQSPNYNNNNQFPSYTQRDPSPSEILRNMDLDIEDLCDPDRKKEDKDVDRIYSMIERNHRALFNTFSSYRIPYPIAKIIIKRIVKLTLSYCEKEGDY